MTLPLFDDPVRRAPRQVTLVRLAGEIARSLGGVGRISVEGEVYRPTTSKGGSVYFVLRDRAAQISVRVPSSAARGAHALEGERVCVVGGLQWLNERGQVHLVAEEVAPVGAGAIAALIAETRNRLAADGLLDRPRRPLPVLPAVVGVVCGADAAVRRDIESVAAVRCPGYPLRFEETSVSGPGSSVSIIEAIERVTSWPGVEIVVLARGGGDAPSLLPWSSEEVCRAVAACPVAVVSAIGHEADRPLCDEVADARFGTPSLAAAAVLPDVDGLTVWLGGRLGRAAEMTRGRIDAALRRLEAVDAAEALQQGLGRASARVQIARSRLVGVHPAGRLERCRLRLAAPDWGRLTWEAFGRAAGRLDADLRHLRALSPQRTLERGYAVVTGPRGVARSTTDVGVGDPVDVRLASGGFHASVTAIAAPPTGDPPDAAVGAE